MLLAAQRTASLRHDDELQVRGGATYFLRRPRSLTSRGRPALVSVQATLINLLLRNYLHNNLYQQADKLVSKTQFPDSAGNPQLSRHLYYLGRIRAVQLSYTEAHTHLQQAIRRAPNATLAPGFYQTVHKLFLVVELLMGDIPERGLFRHPVLKKALIPYLQIVQGKNPSHYDRANACSLTEHLFFVQLSAREISHNSKPHFSKTRLYSLKTGRTPSSSDCVTTLSRPAFARYLLRIPGSRCEISA